VKKFFYPAFWACFFMAVFGGPYVLPPDPKVIYLWAFAWFILISGLLFFAYLNIWDKED